MDVRPALFLTAAALVASCPHDAELAAQARSAAGVRIRVEALKRSTFENKAGRGPVLVGPQSALELEWRLYNNTGATVELSSPAAVFRLRVRSQETDIPVRTDWSTTMTLRSTTNGQIVPAPIAFGPTALPDGASVWVRGSTKRVDESPFPPGGYLLELDVRGLQPVQGGRAPIVDAGNPIELQIVALDSAERRRQFHMIEGAFYRGLDTDLALEHYAALASLPGAPWSDSLPAASLYGELGRQPDACAIFRRILPDLIRGLNGPLGDTLRNAGHVHRAATCFAAEGDVTTAAQLLRLEGRTPEDRIPEEIERLRKAAGKPGRVES